MRRALAAAVGLTLALTGVSSAGMAIYRNELFRFAGTERVNRVTITQVDGGFRVVDRGERLDVRRNCRRLSRRKAVCRFPRVQFYDAKAKLGPGRDSLTVDIDPGDERDRSDGIIAYGGPDADRMVARDDTVVEFFGQGGDDVLLGGRTDSGKAAGLMSGGDGDDEIRAPAYSTQVLGGPGDDRLRAGSGDEYEIFGGDGSDAISMLGGAGDAYGGGGDDVLLGGSKSSTFLNAGAGNDVIDAAAGPGKDVVLCGSGTDSVTLGPNDTFAGLDQDPADAGCESVTQR